MKSSTCALLLMGGCLASGCSTPVPRSLRPSGVAGPETSVRVGVSEAGTITVRVVPLELYVQAASLSEFAPASENAETAQRMFEVQAVIGRTYAISHLGRHARDGYDLCDRTHCQLFQPGRLTTSRWAAQAAAASRNTRAQVLWFDGAPALAVFHADCGGRTSAAADVWGGTLRPYLLSRPDNDGAAGDAHAPWQYAIGRPALQAALNSDLRTHVGRRLDGIRVLERDAAGRAVRVRLDGANPRVVRGVDLREVLAGAFGARSLRSTWFDVRQERGRIVFDGRGFGHGVGLCQAGALARIRAGANLSAVLQRYFPGTKLVKTNG